MSARAAGRWAVLAALALAPGASAGTPEDLVEGARLLKELREEEAIAVLTRVLDRGDGTSEQIAEAWVLLGLSRFNLRDDEGAGLAFRRALTAFSPVALPRNANPKARVLFDEMRVLVEREREEERRAARQPPPTLQPAPAPAPAPPAPVAAVPAVDAPTPRAGARRVARYALVGATLAAVIAGVAFHARAQRLRADVELEPDVDAAVALYQGAVAFNSWGVVLDVVGAAAAVAAVLVWLLPPAGPSA